MFSKDTSQQFWDCSKEISRDQPSFFRFFIDYKLKIPRDGDFIDFKLPLNYAIIPRVEMMANLDKNWEIQLQQFAHKRATMAPSHEDRYFVLMDQRKEATEATLVLLQEKAGKKNLSRFNLQNFEKCYADSRNKSSKKKLLFFSELHLAWLRLEKHEFKRVLQIPGIVLIPENGMVGSGAPNWKKVKRCGIKEVDNWGVRAIGALSSNFTGKGVKIAVLDTGFDEKHPSFRPYTKREYFVGTSASDYNGHGMHCTGIACGASKDGIRLGVAPDVEIYAGKILDKHKEGWPKDMIMGVYWALANSCHVILLSLGFAFERNSIHPMDPILTRVFELACTNSCFVVASAGNDSNRSADPPMVHPMLSPAENSLVIGVGAITSENDILSVSNGAKVLQDGFQQKMDFVAPGEGIFSIWSTQAKNDHQEPYGYQDGTSVAAAFVAGILCLYWEKYLKRASKIKGVAPLQWIRKQMNHSAKTHKDPYGRFWEESDCGQGLLHAPQNKYQTNN